jgi:hypothetical protein
MRCFPILARYRGRTCTFNDDIQGTAGIALASMYSALRITGQKLTDQRFLFLGGGSAGTGISELISRAMTMEGMDISEARSRNALFDVNGLLIKSRTDLADFQKPFAQDRVLIATFVDAVKSIRSTGIIGVSAAPKLFTREVIMVMTRSTSGRSSSSIRTRHRGANAPRRRRIAGRTAGQCLPAAVRFRRPRSTAGASCEARATTFTSFQPWAWRCLQPRRSG